MNCCKPLEQERHKLLICHFFTDLWHSLVVLGNTDVKLWMMQALIEWRCPCRCWVRCVTHYSLLVPILCQINPFCTLSSCSFQIHFNVFHLRLGLPMTSSICFPIKILYSILFFHHACHIPKPIHFPRFNEPRQYIKTRKSLYTALYFLM